MHPVTVRMRLGRLRIENKTNTIWKNPTTIPTTRSEAGHDGIWATLASTGNALNKQFQDQFQAFNRKNKNILSSSAPWKHGITYHHSINLYLYTLATNRAFGRACNGQNIVQYQHNIWIYLKLTNAAGSWPLRLDTTSKSSERQQYHCHRQTRFQFPFRSVECLYHGTSPNEAYIVWQACALYIRNFGYWVAQAQTTPHLLRRTEAWQVWQMEPDFNINLHNLNLLSCYCASFCKILKHLLSICCVRLVSNIISSHQKWISGTWNCKKRVICWAVRAEAT